MRSGFTPSTSNIGQGIWRLRGTTTEASRGVEMGWVAVVSICTHYEISIHELVSTNVIPSMRSWNFSRRPNLVIVHA